MDRSNYKRLGDYIRSVDVRNRDLAVTNLLGVSISKTFIPSIANTIGTDMSTYKVVEPYQFAYGPVTSRNGDKITFALYKGTEKCIISQAYETFEIVDKEQLDPDYLMMWALRPEFDRYARFKSNGSAREIFSWDEMCEVYLPVPDIATQRRIVAEYQAVEKRIATNEQLIAKLEETAQIIYKKMFVDDIDPAHLPDGWRMGTLTEVADFKYGKLPDKHERSTQYAIPVYSGYSITGYTDIPMFDKKIVVIIARGDSGTGRICLSPSRCFLSNLAIGIIPKRDNFLYFLYYYLTKCDTYSLRSGSAQAQITINNLEPFPVLIPSSKETDKFQQRTAIIDSHIDSIISENAKLLELKDLLLTKLTTNN